MIHNLRETISALTPGGKVFFLLLACLLSWFVASFFLIVLFPFAFGVEVTEIINMFKNMDDDPLVRKLIVVFQGGSSLGLFAGGAIVYTYFAEKGNSVWYNWQSQKASYNLVVIFIGVLLLFGVIPFVDLLERINNAIVFPDFLSGFESELRQRHAEMQSQIDLMLDFSSWRGFLLSALVMALIPAVGEEWVFRGKLQGLLQKITNNAHGGIWLTSFIFAFFHQQFFAVIPMFFLSLLLGYLFAYSRSLWVSVMVHFANNFTSLLVYHWVDGDLNAIELPTYMYVLSIIIVLLASWLLVKNWNKLGIHYPNQVHKPVISE
ncbi:MAG: CPBP family intramembrane metalloprotease [Cryomorphaceae bacterium]|nr:CPBP family intramembrane metalloprotease [Cryomorphaceae bacterium]